MRWRDGKGTTWTEQNGLPGNAVRALYEDQDGVLWIGTYDSGLGRFKDGKFTRYTTRDGLFNDDVFQILEDAYGNLWMSCNRLDDSGRDSVDRPVMVKGAIAEPVLPGCGRSRRRTQCTPSRRVRRNAPTICTCLMTFGWTLTRARNPLRSLFCKLRWKRLLDLSASRRRPEAFAA
jgi:hypothetical protein